MTKQISEHTGPQEKPKPKLMFSLSWLWNRKKKKKQKMIEELQEKLKERKRQHGWDV